MEAFQALTGGSFRGMVHPGDLERVESEIMAQIASDTYDYVEYRICCQDGTVLWVEDYGRLVEEENGKVLLLRLSRGCYRKKSGCGSW